MTTEHTVVRSGKSKRKPFNSNVADYLLIIAIVAFSYPLVLRARGRFSAANSRTQKTFDCALHKFVRIRLGKPES
jgi:hypothetical protein